MRDYTVFNADQVDGLPAHFKPSTPAIIALEERTESAEAFFAATKAEIRHGGTRAYYALESD